MGEGIPALTHSHCAIARQGSGGSRRGARRFSANSRVGAPAFNPRQLNRPESRRPAEERTELGAAQMLALAAAEVAAQP